MADRLYVASKRCDPQNIHDEVADLVKAVEEPLGLVMTPNACGLCAWRSGDASGKVCFEGDMALDEAFEVRAFCEHWELRWVRDGCDGVGTLMSEDSCRLSGWNDSAEIPLAGVLDRHYLLWGEVGTNPSTTPPHGWLTLGSNRTGPIPVPLPSARQNAGNRIQLVAREYLAEFTHGNVCVFDQRLLKLVRAGDGKTEETSDE